MSDHNLIYSYKQQISWLDEKKKNADSIDDIKMLSNIINAVVEAKNHMICRNELVHITMTNENFRKYVERVLIPNQS